MPEKRYNKNSISLSGAIGLGTGVMVGAAIFAIIGQVTELAGGLFPISYLGGAVIASCSAYSYVKMAHAYPSAGGIGMLFVETYGKGTITAGSSLLMAISMIFAQSLVARTFGTYTLQLTDISPQSRLVPVLGVGLLVLTFIINLSGNQLIQTLTSLASLIKIVGVALFALAAIWASGFSLGSLVESSDATSVSTPVLGFLASMSLSILAFKGFTTITNNGAEIINPKKNIGRAITLSIAICTILYLLVGWGVAGNLSLSEIIAAKDYALAQAARPILGSFGLIFTVVIAILATLTVCIGSVFAVSRMTAMLTDMKLIPHRHFGMPGNVQQHMLVYIVVLAILLTIFFDLSRIASLGAVLYLLIDIIFQWGVLRVQRKKIQIMAAPMVIAIILDAIVLGAFLFSKAMTDKLIVITALVLIPALFIGEHVFLKYAASSDDQQ